MTIPTYEKLVNKLLRAYVNNMCARNELLLEGRHQIVILVL